MQQSTTARNLRGGGLQMSSCWRAAVTRAPTGASSRASSAVLLPAKVEPLGDGSQLLVMRQRRDRPQPALRHLVAGADRQALDGFDDARVEPQQLQDVADVPRPESGELRQVVARAGFTAIEDALPASREL